LPTIRVNSAWPGRELGWLLAASALLLAAAIIVIRQRPA